MCFSLNNPKIQVLIKKAFGIFSALLYILSQFVKFTFITFVVADDQHHNNCCLQCLSRKTSSGICARSLHWQVSACPVPSFRKPQVAMDASLQPYVDQLVKDPFRVCHSVLGSLPTWQDPFQNKQQRDNLEWSLKLWNKTHPATDGSQDSWAILPLNPCQQGNMYICHKNTWCPGSLKTQQEPPSQMTTTAFRKK